MQQLLSSCSLPRHPEGASQILATLSQQQLIPWQGVATASFELIPLSTELA